MMSTLTSTRKRTLVLASAMFLAAAFMQGCGEDRDEQAAAGRGQESGRQTATTEQARTGPSQTGAVSTTPGQTGWIGKQVVGKDGQVLGTITEHKQNGKEFGYVLIKGEDGKMHPVPANYIKSDTTGERLRADVDQSAFRNSPSYSEAERQQLSDTQLQEVRGYYESKSQEPSSQPQHPQSKPQTPESKQ